MPIPLLRMETGMDGQEGQTHYVKRVVLPSGKTIEVVYFKETDEPAYPVPEQDQALHICLDCESELVYPVEWEEAGPESWTVLLHCPNCDEQREGVFHQETVEHFDEELDRGAEGLARDYRRLVRANMADELGRFVAALEADAILPEDF
jgi:hypothetical protein